jgi:hypothetical protein
MNVRALMMNARQRAHDALASLRHMLSRHMAKRQATKPKSGCDVSLLGCEFKETSHVSLID